MNRFTTLLILVAGLGAVQAAPPATNSAATNRTLNISRSFTPVAGGKATLIIGPLERTGDIYAGDYQMKVSPYFFKSEKGRLAILVSDASLHKVTNGHVAEITGTATTNGKDGETRIIGATATPTNHHQGTLKLWFTAGDRKMEFNTTYHFLDK